MKRIGILFVLVALTIFGSQLLIVPHVSAAQIAESMPPPISLDVVSVKRDKDETGGFGINSPRDGDNITITNMSPHMLVGIAFGFSLHDEIYGLPGWTDREAYDLTAKVSDKDLTAFHELSPMQRNPLLQQVLVSRFHLQYHYDTKILPAYALVIGKVGEKLVEVASGTSGSEIAPIPGQIHTRHGEIIGKGLSMTDFARVLSQQIGRPIADKTGLQGNYDFRLDWTPEMSSNSTSAPAAEAGPSLFTALQEQLGLKLQSAKVPVRVLVVDHIDRPDLN